MAQPAEVDPQFKPAFSGAFVHSVASAPGGKVLLGGNFGSVDRIPRSCIAQLNADGSLDRQFDPGKGANAEVLAVAAQRDAKVVLAGSFTSVNGLSRNRIARLNPDGSHDEEFDAGKGADRSVRAVRLQPDGKILIGGEFSRFDGIARSCVARLNPDGSLDTGFDPGRGVGGTTFVNALAELGDGKVLVAGDFSSFDGHPCGSIVRLRPNGSFDASFDSGVGTTPDNPIISIVVQPDGKIVIGGSFYKYRGVSRVNIARLNSDGTLDESFDPGKGISGGLYNMIQSVALWEERILVGGSFARVNGTVQANLVALDFDGHMCTNALPVVDSPVRFIVVNPDDSILLGGEFTKVGGAPHSRVARLRSPAPETRLLSWGFAGPEFRCRATSTCPSMVCEASTDLVQWTPIRTNATVNGMAEFHDANEALPCRFYRVRPQ
ncbi:MAG: delta-60 repeat domain-containing protein [Verrucomicrobiia bacterium]